MIREVLVLATLIYLLIIAVQLIDRPALWLQSLAVAAALGLAAGVYWFREELRLGKWEAVALWAAVLLFVIYAIAGLGGLV